jgi:hypothetical protein
MNKAVIAGRRRIHGSSSIAVAVAVETLPLLPSNRTEAWACNTRTKYLYEVPGTLATGPGATALFRCGSNMERAAATAGGV